METYKREIPDIKLDPDNLSESSVLGAFHEWDSEIPLVLVNEVQKALIGLGEDLIPSPIMIDPRDSSLVIGVIEKTDEGLVSKYQVIISKKRSNEF